MPDLKLDYTRLFISLEHASAPPYASVYLGKEKIMFDLSTLDIRDLYRRYGLKSRTSRKEPDDHIGLELSFLQFLCLEATKSNNLKSSDVLIQDMKKFLESHLNKWLPDFVQSVKKHAETEFYAGIADVTEGTVLELTDYLSTL